LSRSAFAEAVSVRDDGTLAAPKGVHSTNFAQTAF
jgi:hypothetical protein